MQLEVKNTEDNYYEFFKSYYLKKDLIGRLLLLIIFSLLIATAKEINQPYVLSKVLIKFFITALFFVVFFSLLPYTIATIRFQNSIKTKPLIQPQTIILIDDGIQIIARDEITFWCWETLNKAGIINRYLFFTLFTNRVYPIPLTSFASNDEAINFLGIIKSNIQKAKGDSKPRKIRNLYYWGLVGFIPNFGVLIGIILIINGLKYENYKIISVGVIDVLMTVFFWLVIFPFLRPT